MVIEASTEKVGGLSPHQCFATLPHAALDELLILCNCPPDRSLMLSDHVENLLMMVKVLADGLDTGYGNSSD